MTEKSKRKKKPCEDPRYIYTKELGDRVCKLTASTGFGLQKLTEMYPDLPSKSTINRWRLDVPEFKKKYDLAKLEQADRLAEECLEIADDTSGDAIIDPDTGQKVCNHEFIARSRLRIDTRKWLASKLLPKQYGKAADEVEKSQSEALVIKLIDKLID